MANWRELALVLNGQDYKADPLTWLTSVLAENTFISNPKEYSDFFKFLSISIRTKPCETLPVVIERIIKEWRVHAYSLQIRKPFLFRATLSFLIRLKKGIRKEFFRTQIFPLWNFLFMEIIEEEFQTAKLFLVREYRRELSFDWLFSYVQPMNPASGTLFYTVNLSGFELENSAQAAIDILIELLGKVTTTPQEDQNDEWEDLRVSGVLEKIGSLWRADALMNPLYRGKILKLLALASFVSGAANNIFDSLTGLMDILSSEEFLKEGPNANYIWMFRLVESVIKKYPAKQYVLSQSRAELSEISRQIIKISSKAVSAFYNYDSIVPVCGMMKSVLERWESFTECPVEIENEFMGNVENFINSQYSMMIEIEQKDDENKLLVNLDSKFELLTVFIKYFISPFKPILMLFFRNALKQATLSNFESIKSLITLNLSVSLLVGDGGTDFAFKKIFLDHPSLVGNVHLLIDRIDREYTESSSIWLMNLCESPRTRDILIDFLIDPDQIISLNSDSFWMNFFNKILKNSETTAIEKIFKWTKGKLVDEFYKRFRPDFDFIDPQLIKTLLSLETFRSHQKFPEILKFSKNDNQLLIWILSNISEFQNSEILLELTPFGDEKVSKVVYGILKKNSLKESVKLIDEIFDKFCINENALNQWNLLVESNNLKYLIDSDFIELPPSDYGNYLQDLLGQISKTQAILINDSNDMIEMYLEYFKYGHVRSIKIIQIELLKRYKCIELLVRIPFNILKRGGKEFGQRVLDDFMINGMDRDDVYFIKNAGDDVLEILRDYYKLRLTE